jgi:hypothetical protein
MNTGANVRGGWVDLRENLYDLEKRKMFYVRKTNKMHTVS